MKINNKKIIRIIISLISICVLGVWIYLAFFTNNQKLVELLLPPIERYENISENDYTVIGTNSNLRIDLDFEKGGLNPYPYGISKGTITIINNGTGKRVPINGEIEFRTSAKLVDDRDDYWSSYKNVAMLRDMNALEDSLLPFYTGLDTSFGNNQLIIKNGVGKIEFLYIDRTNTYIQFDLHAKELQVNDTYTLVLLNEIKDSGDLIRTNKRIPFGEYKDFEPPTSIPSKIKTDFEYFYDIQAIPQKIVRSQHKQVEVEFTLEPFETDNLPENIKNNFEVRVLPAYKVSGGVTYPARIVSIKNDNNEELFDWKTRRLNRGRSGGVDGEIKALIRIDNRPITVTLEMTNEPIHIPFVGLIAEIVDDNFKQDFSKIPQERPKTMILSKFIPIQVETDLPDRFIALWYLLLQASKIILGGMLLYWLKYRKKSQPRIDKKLKI